MVPYFVQSLRDNQWRNNKNTSTKSKICKVKIHSRQHHNHLIYGKISGRRTMSWKLPRPKMEKANWETKRSVLIKSQKWLFRKQTCRGVEAGLSKKKSRTGNLLVSPPEFSATGFPHHIMRSHVNMPPLATWQESFPPPCLQERKAKKKGQDLGNLY